MCPINGDGEEFHMLRVEECDRQALTVAMRLARLAERVAHGEVDGTLEEYEVLKLWILPLLGDGAASFEPRAVTINLERLANDWDAESANESDTTYPVR